MALVDTVQRVQGKGNDIRRRLLLPPSTRCFLLKGSGETQRLEPVLELTKGWNIKFNEYRGALVLSVADLELTRDQVGITSYIAYGVEPKLDVYKIDPSRIDVYEPTTLNAFWKIYAIREAKRRYTI